MAMIKRVSLAGLELIEAIAVSSIGDVYSKVELREDSKTGEQFFAFTVKVKDLTVSIVYEFSKDGLNEAMRNMKLSMCDASKDVWF